jgi:hypothetical protein
VHLDRREPLIGLDQKVEPAKGHHGYHSGRHDRDQHPPPTPIHDQYQPASQDDHSQDARSDHDDGDDPLRNGAESAQQIRRERHQRVAEEPLDSEQDQHHYSGHDGTKDVCR